jgi:hypothetical protein
MIGDTTKDYMTAFLGVFFIFLSIIVIREIREKKRYWIPLAVVCIFLAWLGIDKVNRDNNEKSVNDKHRHDDSVTISGLSGKLDKLVEGRKQDSADNFKFFEKLESKYHIKDSSGIPIRNNYIDNSKHLVIPDNHGRQDIKF